MAVISPSSRPAPNNFLHDLTGVGRASAWVSDVARRRRLSMSDRLSPRVSSRLFRRLLNARYLLLAACLLVAPGLARTNNGWELQQTKGQPAFATAVPS